MAGRDERRGRDPDDWFAGPERLTAHEGRPNTAPARGDDWLGGADGQQALGPRLARLGAVSAPRLALAVVAVVALVGLGLALSGAFTSATPPRAATSTTPTGAGTTSAATTATQPLPSPTAAPSGPLKPGDQGTEVKVLQRALVHLGYQPGTVDGSYGPSTQHAVTEFQRFAKVTPDGILGPQTLRALRNALTRR
jgi:hypothetical protein